MHRILIGAAALAIVAGSTPAWGSPVVKVIPYGQATTLSHPASYRFRFSLWTAQSGGTRVFVETKRLALATSSVVTDLGDSRSGGLDGVDFSQQYWVQTEVYDTGLARFIRLGERARLRAVAYSFWSAEGQPGPQGPQGPSGPKGDTGGPGGFDLTKRYVVNLQAPVQNFASCSAATDRILGGGGDCTATGFLIGSHPETVAGVDRWVVLCQDALGANANPVAVQAICVTP